MRYSQQERAKLVEGVMLVSEGATRTGVLLDFLRDREMEEWSVSGIAAATGMNARTVATTIANSISRPPRYDSESGWSRVERVRHGTYRYNPNRRHAPESGAAAMEAPAETAWVEVARDRNDTVVLRGPDGVLYVPIPLAPGAVTGPALDQDRGKP